MESAQKIIVVRSNNGASVAFVIVALLLASAATWAAYRIFMGQPVLPAVLGDKFKEMFKKEPAPTSEAEAEDRGTTDVPGGTNGGTYTPVGPATVSASGFFPLQEVTGAALHQPNPFVRDLQEFLNKKYGKNLDEDGAFGKMTVSALKSATGDTSISMSEYNSMIAPYLGKPQIS